MRSIPSAWPSGRLRLVTTLRCLCLAGFAACGGNEPTEPRPSLATAPPNGNNPAVHVTPKRDTVNALGDTAQLSANVAVQWSSLDPAIASVDTGGHVIGLAPGLARIQAIAVRKGDTALVLVRQVVAAVTVTPAGDTLLPGEQRSFTASVTDSNGAAVAGAAVQWSSSSPATATVDAGLVTAVAPGSVTISATAGGRSGTADVRVRPFGPWRLLTAGLQHTCGLTTDGLAYCWGEGLWGRLGNGDQASTDVPTAVSGGLRFTTLVAGDFDTCGLVAGGAAYCWGYNYVGQLGDGTTNNRTVPTPVLSGVPLQALAPGNTHTCALGVDGAAYCWGSNVIGELGLGGPAPDTCPFSNCALTPQPVAGGLAFSAIGASTAHTCGVALGGLGYCWGDNASGELGDGTIEARNVPTEVFGGLLYAPIVTLGRNHSCAVDLTGDAFCWGSNRSGQMGGPPIGFITRPSPVLQSGTTVSLSAGYNHTCRALADASAQCWGNNDQGQIGNGSTDPQYGPASVLGGLSMVSVAAGGQHTCGLTRERDAYCWGYNLSGQLGNGGRADAHSPVLVRPPAP